MLSREASFVIDFYSEFRKVVFPSEKGEFDTAKAVKLLGSRPNQSGYITLLNLTLDRMRDWHFLWVSTESSKVDLGMIAFNEVSKSVLYDVRFFSWAHREIRDLLSSWMVFEL